MSRTVCLQEGCFKVFPVFPRFSRRLEVDTVGLHGVQSDLFFFTLFRLLGVGPIHSCSSGSLDFGKRGQGCPQLSDSVSGSEQRLPFRPQGRSRCHCGSGPSSRSDHVRGLVEGSRHCYDYEDRSFSGFPVPFRHRVGIMVKDGMGSHRSQEKGPQEVGDLRESGPKTGVSRENPLYRVRPGTP